MTLISRNVLFYVLVLLAFGASTWFMLDSGSRLNRAAPAVGEKNELSPGRDPASPPPSSSPANGAEVSRSYLGRILKENLRTPLSILLLQIIVIITTARIVGGMFRKIGQPAVIGEMVAGIILGPSLLGALAPGAVAFLFPGPSMETLKVLSEFGVLVFMFVVGMEVNSQHLREKAHAAVMVSHASIVVPFSFGIALSLLIYTSLGPSSTSFTAFALFIGVSMSITAFPVLARIVEESGMSRTHIGSTALACAAVDDVTAWCLLAVVVAIVKADGIAASVVTIVLTLLFISIMILLVKPWLGRLMKANTDYESSGKGLIAAVLAFVLACSWITQTIGIHALFGAFLAGVVMPSPVEVRSFLKAKLDAFSSAALLPLFFAFTGLRTQINLLNDQMSWLFCVGIVAVAIAGKLGGSMTTARWTGMGWKDSFSIGVLMNTRGLMELVVLNIGYELGILPARIFSIMVIMALVTTSMAGPLLKWIKSGHNREFVAVQNAGGQTV
jgi:Kef-type K+ transport system membrane component KefB